MKFKIFRSVGFTMFPFSFLFSENLFKLGRKCYLARTFFVHFRLRTACECFISQRWPASSRPIEMYNENAFQARFPTRRNFRTCHKERPFKTMLKSVRQSNVRWRNITYPKQVQRAHTVWSDVNNQRLMPDILVSSTVALHVTACRTKE